MSNCIELFEPHCRVRFKRSQIAGDLLRDCLKEARKMDWEDLMVPAHALRDQLWWFLKENTRFEENGDVEIAFGKGHSTHTWRDFEGTLQALTLFIKGKAHHSFRVADESDGFQSQGWMPVDFQEGKILWAGH